MGVSNPSALDTANTVAQVAFEDVMSSLAAPQSSLYTKTYSTGSAIDEQIFMAYLSGLREWLGDREYGNFEIFKQTTTLTTWEQTFALPRKFVDYDLSGAVSQSLATEIQSVLSTADDQIVTEKLVSNSGAGPIGFDATNLLSTSHAFPTGTTYSNLTTSALSFSTYEAARVAMAGYKSANGRPLDISPTHLMVGPKLESQAREIVGATERLAFVSATGVPGLQGSGLSAQAAAQIPNVYAGEGVQLVVNKRLTGTADDYWYLMDLSQGMKPMQLKDERAFSMIEATDMKDHERFHRDLYIWGVEGDKVAAAGAWPTIYGGIL